MLILPCIRLAVAACLLLPAGCTWKSPQSTSSFAHWNLTPAQHDSLAKVFAERQKLKNENRRLRKQVKTQNLDLVKLSAELEYRIDRNGSLEDELANAQKDLAQVEKQFVNIEHQLQANDTKASAVAVLAEVKIRYDNILKNDSISPDSVIIGEIEYKLKESEQQLQKNNFAASAYYAKRADRLIQLAQNDNTHIYSDDATRIVSVSRANLRQGPGTHHSVITNLDFGTVLIQVDQTDDWSRIRTKEGREGWILTALLR